jgi:hypothetical protein
VGEEDGVRFSGARRAYERERSALRFGSGLPNKALRIGDDFLDRQRLEGGPVARCLVGVQVGTFETTRALIWKGIARGVKPRCHK